MAHHFAKGTQVTWSWGGHHASGVVAQKFTHRGKRTSKGTTAIRNASDDEPAYLVRQTDGATALKSESELTRA